MRAIEDAIAECFAFVGTAQAAAEIEHSVVIFQGQAMQIAFAKLQLSLMSKMIVL